MFGRKWVLLVIVLFTAVGLQNATFAQDDSCSLPAVLASFQAAAVSEEVDAWVQRYSETNCSQNIKLAVTTFALGYRQAYATSLGGNETGISVDANGVWTTTGIVLKKGEHFTISATGNVNPCKPNTICDKWHPADGETNVICIENECLLNDAPYSALVARIGEGITFLVGSQGEFIANDGGELQFAVNDRIHHDNRGSFSVTVALGN